MAHIKRMTENTESKQVGWVKGQSGNPSGRPKGAKNKTTLAAESLLKDHAEAITQKVIDLALQGDLLALKMCMDRLLPLPRRPVIEQTNMTIKQETKRYVVAIPAGVNNRQEWLAKYGRGGIIDLDPE